MLGGHQFINNFNKSVIEARAKRLKKQVGVCDIVHTKEESIKYFELPEIKNAPNWEIDNFENQIKL